MTTLSSSLRKTLEDACVRGRRAADLAARSALSSLGVADKTVPTHLSEDDRSLRRGLRAKSRQLGDEEGSIELLIADCAFEQWHRLLFARFLAENGLLIHPKYRAPVSLADCEELASDLGEPDGWAVAGRFAAEILPGIFRLDDPCVQVRLAPEGRLALEGIVGQLPAEIFAADDALGWVYQFWQKDKKDEVNASERKIGGADLGPVTQLFTENYMVRFLLENSLGAWWAARHPNSPLLKDFEFLRFNDDGSPAAGSFDGWPETIANVTVMDPCCGSGHFLVESFDMLWKMRAEAEGLSATAAQDAVLKDNLFGLELDPRCVEIAMFAVALSAWKAGGGWRELPIPNIACSGIPVKAPVEEWKALAGGDPQLENALVRLHILFKDADTLGSLIDPKRAVELTDRTGLQKSFDDVDWDDVAPLITKALAKESHDPATKVLGADAAGIARAADFLSRRYTLVATNVPYLGRSKQGEVLRDFASTNFRVGSADLATVFLLRVLKLCQSGGSLAIVSPQNWLVSSRYREFRIEILKIEWNAFVQLGEHAFTSTSAAGALVALAAFTPSGKADQFFALDVAALSKIGDKTASLIHQEMATVSKSPILETNDLIISANPQAVLKLPMLEEKVDVRAGLLAGDTNRFTINFWEVGSRGKVWEFLQVAPDDDSTFSGMSRLVRWENEQGDMAALAESVRHLNHVAQNWRRGKPLWGKRGVVFSLMRSIRPALYLGDRFGDTCTVVVPNDPDILPGLWAFAKSGEWERELRSWRHGISITPNDLVKVPFDLEHWTKVAQEQYPDGLPEPWSDDPTQWLFEGRPEVSTDPLQVAVGRLLGYQWPEQPESDDLDELADDDGIVCLPSLRGERPAAERLQELLARALGGTWSPARVTELLVSSGSKKKDIESWIRDDFFKAHCQLFKNRPFIWQIWDGRKDGFSALVNYHRLDRTTLERLTYTYLGDWIERQTAGVRDDEAGAEDRLAAAQQLQRNLELILEGEPPFDVYVRWKSLAEQPIGWDPDLNDGVRLNVRPFIEAGILRSKFNVKWDKDRGKNPDGTERFNDLHFTTEEKLAGR